MLGRSLQWLTMEFFMTFERYSWPPSSSTKEKVAIEHEYWAAFPRAVVSPPQKSFISDQKDFWKDSHFLSPSDCNVEGGSTKRKWNEEVLSTNMICTSKSVCRIIVSGGLKDFFARRLTPLGGTTIAFTFFYFSHQTATEFHWGRLIYHNHGFSKHPSEEEQATDDEVVAEPPPPANGFFLEPRTHRITDGAITAPLLLLLAAI